MKNAFVLRIKPSGVDRVPDALQTNEVMIGWSKAEGLLDPSLDWKQFRQIIHDAYHPTEQSYNRSGGAAGHMWRFVRDMDLGDWVVVPYGNEFFVAEIEGPPRYDAERKGEDTAYRRRVSWLNAGKSIPRRYARAALQSRMKTQGTCAVATDLVEEIEDAIQAAGVTEAPTFEKDLRLTLVGRTTDEIRSGRIDNYGFEHLVATVLNSLGASEVRVLSRSHEDKGTDIIAHFPWLLPLGSPWRCKPNTTYPNHP